MTGRIVVVDTMGGLGDLLLALPMIEALARSHPGSELTVVTTAPWHVLLERDPRIQEVVPVPGRDPESIVGTVRPVLERIRPDLAVTTNRQHGLPEVLEALSARAVTNLWRNPPQDELVDLRYLRLLVEDGFVEPSFGELPPRLVLGEDELAAVAPLLDGVPRPALLFPDSGMAVKRWPLRAWADLVRELQDDGQSPVVVSEVAQQRAVLGAAGAVVAPDLDLRALAAFAVVAARAGGAAIGGDTGPVRLASAAGMRVVGLFGPTLMRRYGYRSPSFDIQGYPDCPVRLPTAITEQECWWAGRCPLTPDHAPRCMGAIRVEEVLAGTAWASPV